MKRIIIIILLLIFTSCLGTKKISEISKETTQIEKTEIKSDSSFVKETNKAIDDKASFKVPESNTGDAEFDRRVNEGIVNALKGMDFQKTSGDNSYRLWYDIDDRLIKMEAKIGETSDTTTDINKEETSEKTFTQKNFEYIYKKVTTLPWWAWIIIVYLLRKRIINIIATVVPGVREIKTVKDLLNPPNKKTT